MRVIYFPQKLKLEKEKVISLHRRASKFNPEKDLEGREFIKFVKLLAKISKEKVLDFMKMQEPEIVSKLSWYISTNKMELKYDNLFTALFNFASKDDWRIIFEDWQDHYKNVDVQNFLANSYNQANNFIEYIKENFPVSSIKWIENIPIDSVTEIFGNATTIEQFTSKMTANGIIPDKKLYKACISKFFLNCNGEEYIKHGDKGICRVYYALLEEERISLIENMLTKLIITELDNFYETQNAIDYSLNVLFRKKLEFKLQQDKLLNKYKEWCDRITLRNAFEGDSYRFHFWVDYQKGKKTYDKDIGFLYIDFGNYVVTEFTKESGGACYIMKKEFFNSEISYAIGYMSKIGIQNHLKSKSDDATTQKQCLRLIHQPPYGGWRSNFRAELGARNIYPSSHNAELNQ